MKFSEAFQEMKKGNKVKLPSWSGYWAWENETIMMHCRSQDSDEGQGSIIDIRETQRPEYTFDNIASEDWIIADESNTPILGGTARMSFGRAFDLLKRGVGIGMRLPSWKEDVLIKIQFPDEHSKMTAPYLYVESRFGRVPWKETMIELFSDEWEVIYNK